MWTDRAGVGGLWEARQREIHCNFSLIQMLSCTMHHKVRRKLLRIYFIYLIHLLRWRQVVDEIKSWTLWPPGFREILSIFNLELTKGFQQWVVSFVMVTLRHRSEHKVLSLTPANLVHIHICSHTQVWSIPGSHDNYWWQITSSRSRQSEYVIHCSHLASYVTPGYHHPYHHHHHHQLSS